LSIHITSATIENSVHHNEHFLWTYTESSWKTSYPKVWVFGLVDTSHTPALGFMQVVQQRNAKFDIKKCWSDDDTHHEYALMLVQLISTAADGTSRT